MDMEQISYEAYYNMQKYSQIVLDIISDIEDDYQEYSVEDVGSKQYEIMNLLEVINPERADDIRILKSLERFLEDIK